MSEENQKKKFKVKFRKTLVKELVKNGADLKPISILKQNPVLNEGTEEEILDYINTTAADTEKEFSAANMDDPNFRILTEWCEYFVDKGYNQRCSDTLPFALQCIAITESQPTVVGTKISYKTLYDYMACVLQGYPTPELNPDCLSVLKKVNDELLEEIDKVDLDATAITLQEVLKNGYQDPDAVTPFQKFLQHEDINVFKFPSSFLTSE